MRLVCDDSPSAVVGIATRNRAKWLQTAITSALQQSHHPLRIAVIDDGSSDATPSLRKNFPMVSWERRDKAQGHVRARNAMMLSANEDYYVSLDDDAWFVQGDEIAVAVDFLTRHPKAAAVAFDIISPDRSAQTPRGVEMSVAQFIGCGHLLRLSVARELAGYTESPGAYGGDEKDFCLRAIDAGYEIIELAGVHVWHDKTPLARDLPEQHRSGVCNDLTLVLRRVPAVLVVPTVVVKFAKHLLFSIKHGLFRAGLLGMRDFLSAAPEIWRARLPVRAASLAQFYSLSRAPRKAAG